MLWEGWEQLPQLLSSEMELEHEALQSQKEPWNIFEPSRIPLSAVCGVWCCSWAQEGAVAQVGCCSQWVIWLNNCPQGCEQGNFVVQRFQGTNTACAHP